MTNEGKVKIETITNNLIFRMILFNMVCVYGTQALHEASKFKFQHVISCLTPIIFNWCGGLLSDTKRQLTKGKHGNLKKFGFGLILVTFVLEQVPLIWYQWVEVPDPSPRDPRLVRWSQVMPQGGMGQHMHYPP